VTFDATADTSQARHVANPALLAALAVAAIAAATLAGAWFFQLVLDIQPAIYHSGVEWHFWQGPTACTGPVGNLGSAGNLLERLDAVKVVRCDEVQWRFLGLSLAGYNVLISLLMAAIAAWGMVRTARRSQASS
jgi:disulfide bond formation protein DsbB